MRALGGSNDFVEFDLNRLRISTLRVLNEEDHQEGDDRRSSIDDELPRIAEPEHGSGYEPDANDCDREGEDARTPAKVRCSFGEAGVPGGDAHEGLFLGCLTFE